MHPWLHDMTTTCIHNMLLVLVCGQSRIAQAGWNHNRRTWDETWERFQGPWILLEGFGAKICNLPFKHALKSVPGRQPRSALTLVAGGPRWWRDTISFKAAHMLREWLHTRVQSGSFYCSPLSDPCLLFLSLSLSGSVFMFYSKF